MAEKRTIQNIETRKEMFRTIGIIASLFSLSVFCFFAILGVLKIVLLDSFKILFSVSFIYFAIWLGIIIFLTFTRKKEENK